MSYWFAVALLALSSGCSFVFVRGAPQPAAREPAVDCTRSVAAPTVDLMLSGMSVTTGVIGLATSKPSCAPHDWCFDFSGASRAAGAALVTAGAVELASSIYGYAATRGCRDTQDAQQACRAGDDRACSRLLPPMAPP